MDGMDARIQLAELGHEVVLIGRATVHRGDFALEQVREADEELHRAAMTLVRAVGHLPGIRELSNHMMAIGTVS
jgi:hypothetical protein